MSLFKTVDMPCPACRNDVAFEAVSSVNADRRPDYRDEILVGDFQRGTCGHCGKRFRLDPELTYLDLGRGQWIVVHGFRDLDGWNLHEAQAQSAFDRGYGPGANAAARELGARLKPRVVFGWPALREKLFVVAQGLDDVELELTKIAVFRGSEKVPLTAETELRLLAVEGDELVLCWIVAETEELIETLRVPRSLYDEVAADRAGWQPLRDEFAGRCFVDMQRLMIDPVAAAA